MACQVVSVPEVVKRTSSAQGTISVRRRAASPCSSISNEQRMPRASPSSTAAVTSGWPWPSMLAPNDVQKSMYSLPSTSQMREPFARAATNGRPVPRCRRAAAVTPPGSTRWASSKYCSERVTSRVCCTISTVTVPRLSGLRSWPGCYGTPLPAFNSESEGARALLVRSVHSGNETASQHVEIGAGASGRARAGPLRREPAFL